MIATIYFAIATAVFGAQAFVVNLGGVRLSLFRVAIVLMMFVLIIKLLESKGRIDSVVLTYSPVFYMVWILYAMITLAWCKSMSLWIQYMYFLFVGVLCVLVFSLFLNNIEKLKNAFKTMQYMSFVIGAICWYEIITRDYRFISQKNLDYYSNFVDGVPIATMGNPNNLAVMLMMSFFVAIACLSFTDKKWEKLISLAAIVNCAALEFMTQSRGGMLGMALGLMFLLFVSKKAKIFIPASIAVVLIAFSGIIEKIYKIFRVGEPAGASDTVRIALMKNSRMFLLKSFGFGVGSGQSQYWLQYNSFYSTDGIYSMHNWWAEIAASYGIGIFIGYMIYYCKLFLNLFSAYRYTRDKDERAMSLSVCCVMVGFVIASVSSSSTFTSEWFWMFWAVATALQSNIIRQNRMRLAHNRKY